MSQIWRTARVFISSTFRDMHAERDHLVKRVLPRLRARLAEYRVYLEDVDLRWGVTEEQAKSGRAVELCLEETDGCRPVFLCLLGSRYGWVPHDGELNEGLRQRFPWTAQYRDRSITELEILYAALDTATQPPRAFFCFRDERVHDSIPEPIRSSDYVDANPTAARRLADLKQRIRNSGLPCLDGYSARWDSRIYDPVNDTWGRLVDFDEFGNRVEEELWQIIKAEHRLPDSPPADDLDPLALEADYHERFKESRLRIHVGREADNRLLMAYTTGDDTVPCLLGGEMGSGKSTALAKLVETCRRERPRDFVLAHFLGASPEASRLRAMLRRCCLELKHYFDLPNEVPEELDALVLAFRGMLFDIPKDRRAVLVLDAIDQLEEEGSARQLSWLPEELPPHVKVILSCRFEPSPDGPSQACREELSHRQVLLCEISPLSDDECRQIARAVPSLAAKTLSDAQLDLLLNNPATRNPLYLRVALEELRGFGSFDRLTKRIVQFPQGSAALVELFDQVLGRLEDDFEIELVRTSLTLMILARSGLAEHELETLCSSLSGADELFALLRHLRPYLRPRGDRLDFAHQAPVEAIKRRYLRSERARRGGHRKLADFFAKLPRSDRQVHELPWQWAQAADWIRLYQLLAEPDFFSAAWKAEPYEVKARWVELESEGGPGFRMIQAYQHILDDPASHLQSVGNVARMLEDFGHLRQALALNDFCAAYYRNTEAQIELARSLNSQGRILQVLGDLDGAMTLHQQQEEICRGLANKEELSSSFCSQATIHYVRGELDRAMELLKHGEQICRELGNKGSLAAALGNQAVIHQDRGELDRAMELLKHVEQISLELGNKDSLHTSLGNQASVHRARGELDRAMELHRQEEQICRELGNKQSLAASLGNQALIHRARGELDRAIELLKHVEQISLELGYKDSLQKSLSNQASIHQDRGELDRAMELHRQQEQICRELGNKDSLQRSLGNQANIHYSHGELDRAMELHRQQEQICRELGDKDSLQWSLGSQANIHYAHGELDRAMELYRQWEQICRELGKKESLATSLGNQALIHRARGELDRAMELHRQEEQICRELSNKHSLQISLGNQALIHKDRGELDRAMELHRQQEQICRELGNKDSLRRSLGNQALIHRARGELDRAMELYRQEEQICRELGKKESLATSLGNQASIHRSRGELDRAMELLKHVEQICRELGKKESLATSLGNQALIHQDRGELDRAMELLKHVEQICRELGKKESLATSLGNQALIHQDRGELDRAMELHRQEEQICRELGDKDSLQWSLGSQANIHYARGELDRAMELNRQAEQICRKLGLGNKHSLQRCLGNQALIHQDRGELDCAMDLYRQQEQICRELDNKNQLAQSLANQASLLAWKRQQPQKALLLAEEALRLTEEHGYNAQAKRIRDIRDKIQTIL